MARDYVSPNFDRLSAYDPDAAFKMVRMGAQSGMIEVDFNESQQIQYGKLTSAISAISGGGGYLMNNNTHQYASGRYSLSDDVAVLNGEMIYVSSLSISATDGDTIYLDMYDKTVTASSILKKYGNEQETVEVPNNIRDDRFPEGEETSRRTVLAYNLSKINNVSGHRYVELGSIQGGEFVKLSKTLPTLESLDGKADIDSPEFTGVPTAPIPGDGAPGNQISTVDYAKKVGTTPQGTTTGTATAFLLDLEGFTITDGATIKVKFHIAPAEGATLNINNTTAIPLQTIAGATPYVKLDIFYGLIYNSSAWVINDLSGNSLVGELNHETFLETINFFSNKRIQDNQIVFTTNDFRIIVDPYTQKTFIYNEIPTRVFINPENWNVVTMTQTFYVSTNPAFIVLENEILAFVYDVNNKIQLMKKNKSEFYDILASGNELTFTDLVYAAPSNYGFRLSTASQVVCDEKITIPIIYTLNTNVVTSLLNYSESDGVQVVELQQTINTSNVDNFKKFGYGNICVFERTGSDGMLVYDTTTGERVGTLQAVLYDSGRQRYQVRYLLGLLSNVHYYWDLSTTIPTNENGTVFDAVSVDTSNPINIMYDENGELTTVTQTQIVKSVNDVIMNYASTTGGYGFFSEITTPQMVFVKAKADIPARTDPVKNVLFETSIQRGLEKTISGEFGNFSLAGVISTGAGSYIRVFDFGQNIKPKLFYNTTSGSTYSIKDVDDVLVQIPLYKEVT